MTTSKLRLSTTLLLLCAALAASGARAATYDEALQGDLPGYFLDPSVPVLDLTSGANTVTGTVNFVYDEGEPLSDYDAINLFVPTGYEISRIKLVQSVGAGNGTLTTVGWQIYDLSDIGLPIAMQQFGVPSTTRRSFKRDLPIASGRYSLDTTSFIGSVTAGQSKMADYTFTVFTSPMAAVPEPASLALMLAGLAGLGGVGHARRRAARG